MDIAVRNKISGKSTHISPTDAPQRKGGRGCKVCKVEETETGENGRPYNPRKNDLQTETPRLRSRRDLEEPLRCLAWYIRDRVSQHVRLYCFHGIHKRFTRSRRRFRLFVAHFPRANVCGSSGPDRINRNYDVLHNNRCRRRS